jgi:peptidoglycan-associated lipoprotein
VPPTPNAVTDAKPQRRAPAPDVAALPPAPGDDAIYFNFDSALLGDDARSALKKLATTLSKQSREALVIEGNCDETGTIEYNLALGEQRARSAKEYLSHLGVPARDIRTVSYGSTRPKFPGHDDASHAKNRRDDLRVQ